MAGVYAGAARAAAGRLKRSAPWESSPVRILIVSFYFPPYNTIGAVRASKTARYLRELGHQVRVLSARDQPLQLSLPGEIPDAEVIRTRWLNVNRPVELLLGGRQRVAARGYTAPSALGGLLRRAGRWYRAALNIPDGQIGWLPFAVRSGLRLAAAWRPDVILASAKPWTSLAVAHRLSKKCGVPWVAELRDLWTENLDDSCPAWRRAVDAWLERRWLRSATALVSISLPLAQRLAAKHGQPSEAILNGFDRADLSPGVVPPRGGPLRIVYTGMIYSGHRDPAPLFAALRRLGPAAEQIRVEFYGRYLDTLGPLAARHGVAHLVAVREPVPYHDALRLQQQADVLLLLLETDAASQGVFTGKLFEYLGARRPILALGPHNDVAAHLIRQRGAGAVCWEPADIAARLAAWLNQKQTTGTIPGVAAEALAGLSRQEQVARLEAFLLQAVRPAAAPAPQGVAPRRTVQRSSSR